jgi:hypothetical protein
MDRGLPAVRREVPAAYAGQRAPRPGGGVARTGSGGAVVRVDGGYADPTGAGYAVPPAGPTGRSGEMEVHAY